MLDGGFWIVRAGQSFKSPIPNLKSKKMAWFQRKEKGILTDRSGQNEIPEGQWIKCPGCAEIINRRELLDSALVCPKCSHHLRLDSLGYFELLFDDSFFEIFDQHLRSKDPGKFELRMFAISVYDPAKL